MSLFFPQIRSIFIYLIFARPGNGKTLTAVKMILRMFRGYHTTEARYKKLHKRHLLSNVKLAERIEKRELRVNPYANVSTEGLTKKEVDFIHSEFHRYEGIVTEKGHLIYWENPKQLRWCIIPDCWKGAERHPCHDVDIVMDEAPGYIPGDGWKDLPRWFRSFFSKHRHYGNRIILITQDYKAVDINARRMVGKAWKVTKLFSSRDISATLPDPAIIWGVCLMQEFDPDQVEVEGGHDTKRLKEKVKWLALPSFTWIGRRLVSAYDTTQHIPPYEPEGYEHIELRCLNPNCPYKHVIHRLA